MTDPTPQAERVIEVAPQGVIQHWATSSIGGRGRGRYNCACGFGRASGISYEAFQRHYIIELESALTTMREERDRAQDALRTIVASDDVWEMLEIARTTLKPVSDRQPEGETVVPREAQQLFEETEKIDQMRDDSDWHMAVCLFESAITKIFRLCSQEGEKSDAI